MRVLRWLVALLACAVTSAAYAQDYPVKPVRLVVAFSPGGANDIIARLLAQKLYEAFGETVIVDNRPGAGGNIGSEIVARSVPDGYTLLLGSTGPHTINPHFYRKMPFHGVNDFTPIALVAKSSALLVLHPSVPAANVPQLVALARAKKGKLNYGSSGNGSSGHLAGELFKSMAEIEMTHIAYKGNGPAFTDLIAGQIEMMFANKPGSLPHVKSGKLKAIAITTRERDPALPSLPTVHESVPGFEASTWWGLLGPAAMPGKIVEKLHAAVTRITAMDDVKARMSAMGADVVRMTPEQFRDLIRQDLAKYGKIARTAGIKPE